MNKPDLAAVVERLNALAELYGAKPPTPKAVELWWEAVKGYAVGDVLGALDDWMRSKPKPPMPSDVVAMAADRLSNRIEQQAVAEKASEKREIAQMARTPHGRKVLDRIRAALAGSGSGSGPNRRHMNALLDAHAAGVDFRPSPLTEEEVSAARRATGRLRERVPGEDDEIDELVSG